MTKPTNYTWCRTCKPKLHTSTQCCETPEQDDYAMINTTNETNDTKTTQGIWIGDTGASCHMTNSLNGMIKLKQTNTTIQIGDGKSITGTQVGTWQGFVVNKDGSKSRLTLEEVAYVPTLAMNLFSITKALSNKATLSSNGEMIEVKKNKWKLCFYLKIKTKNGFVPGVRMIPKTKDQKESTETNNNKLPYDKVHAILGHMGETSTRATARNLGIGITRGTSKQCMSCAISKAKQKNLNRNIKTMVKEPGELFSSDISSSRNTGYNGRKYWLLVVDHATNMKWTFLLKDKSQQTEVLVKFVQELQTTHGITIKRWRMDNAGENKKTFEAFIRNKFGIIPEYTARETPQHNGTVERAFAALYGRVRSLLNHAGFDPTRRARLWAEAASTATKLDNISVHDNDSKSPHELFFGYRTKYETHLRTFGEIAVMTKSNTNKVNAKLDDRGMICIFLGYPKDHAGDTYRVLNPQTNKTMITRDLIWLHKLYHEHYQIKNRAILLHLEETSGHEETPEEVAGQDTSTPTDHNNDEDEEDNLEANEQTDQTEHPNPGPSLAPIDTTTTDTNEEQNDPEPAPPLLSPWQKKLQTFYNPTPGQEISEFAFLTALQGGEEPTTFQEAWHHPDKETRESWRESIRKEFRDMIRRGVWRRMKRRNIPAGRTLVDHKWVFKRKKNGIFRSRLVAKGYTQIPGIDFNENFAPVIGDVTMRTVIVIKMHRGFFTKYLDIETAFLHGDLEEEIYMSTPEGLDIFLEEDLNDECVVLIKSIYGLVQSARCYWKKFKNSLISMGFEIYHNDNCLLKRTNEKGIVIICLYVDDLFVTGDKEAVLQAVDDIKEKYNIKINDEEPTNEFIGVTYEQMEDGSIQISQPDTIEKLRKQFEGAVSELKIYKSPAGTGETIIRNKEGISLPTEMQKSFRSGIGMLLWLMKHSRPDISNATREGSKVMDRATQGDYKYMLRIVKYVLETKEMKLLFNKDKKEEGTWRIVGYSDSDFAGDKDNRRSVTGFIIYFMGCPIAWRSRSQKSVALSSTEAEYYGMSDMVTEIIFIKNTLEFLGIKVELPIVVHVDNIGAIYLADNATSSNRTKHIDTRYHYTRDYVEDGIIKVKFVKSENNDADTFTKNTKSEDFMKHTAKYMHTSNNKKKESKEVDEENNG